MKPAFLYGIIGTVLVGGVQLLNMLGNFTGTFGGFLFYAPMLLYFTCIYLSIRKTKDVMPDGILPFKEGLKAGGITAFIICITWGIAFFIGLTHQDVQGFVNYKIAHGEQDQIPQYLAAFSDRQHMFDMTKFWVMPNFLLGFLVIIGATVIVARRKKV